MKEDAKEQQKKKVLGIIGLVLLWIITLCAIYVAWNMATARFSAQFDCTIHNIEYINLTGDGSCMFPLVSGNVSICALPKDIHCSGLMQDVSIMKVLLNR